jgi:hypothetical protein
MPRGAIAETSSEIPTSRAPRVRPSALQPFEQVRLRPEGTSSAQAHFAIAKEYLA